MGKFGTFFSGHPVCPSCIPNLVVRRQRHIFKILPKLLGVSLNGDQLFFGELNGKLIQAVTDSEMVNMNLGICHHPSQVSKYYYACHCLQITPRSLYQNLCYYFFLILNLKNEFSWKEDSSVSIGWSLRFLRELRLLRCVRCVGWKPGFTDH